MPPTPRQPQETSLPSYAVLDCRVGERDTVALVRVRRSAPTNYSCALRWQVGPAGGGGAGRGSAALAPLPEKQAGEFVFDWDVDEIVVPVGLNPGMLRPGEQIEFVVLSTRTFNFSPVVARSSGLIGLDVEAPAPLPSAVTRRWNEPVKRRVDPAWHPAFFSDLVTDFTCTRSGLDAAGTPCFRNSLSFGQAQFGNGEVGLYSDPLVNGTRPLQLMDGKRLLVPEKLPAPITAVGGPVSKTCTHSSPLVSTEKNGLFGYGRFEYRFALLHPQQGMWPAGWSVCLPHWRWPDCEQDTLEISFNRPDFGAVLPYMTNWWRNAAGRPQNEGQFINVFDLLPGFDYGDPHTYWTEWTSERLCWGIDEHLLFSVPNRFFLTDPSNPHDPNRIYMMLQVALGGAGGDCAKGHYPVAPSTYGPGAPAMLVEHMAHYAAPAA